MIAAPEVITDLKPGEVFVFGSNLAGIHAGGAAFLANDFGAKWGKGIGSYGHSYAIPTLDANYERLPLSEIARYVHGFIRFAKGYSDKVFLVTRIGCGIAGFTPTEIAPLFFIDGELFPVHVHLPAEFIKHQPRS